MIAIPPAPQLPEELAPYFWYIAGAAVAVGLALLLWGRRIGRFFLAAVGAMFGVIFGSDLAAMLGAPSAVGQAALGVTLAILCFLLARLVWGVLIGALFEAAALGVLIWHYLPMLPPKQAPKYPEFVDTDFISWAGATGQFLWNSLEVVRQANFGTVMLIIVPAGLLPLMIALLKPRAGLIFISSLVGGLIATASLWLTAARIWPNVWPDDWMRFLIPLGVMTVLTIIGWVYQGHGELSAIRARQKAAQEKDEQPKKDEDKVYLPKTGVKETAKK